MRVLGTQRALGRHTAAEVWFRQRLLDTPRPDAGRAARRYSADTHLPGLAYFGLDVPLGGGLTERADVVLFTPTAVIVVVTRILPRITGGTLRVPLSGPWTFEGVDTRFAGVTEVNPGVTVNRLVFALRAHLRRAGLRAPVRGLVCVTGPRIRVRQDRTSRGHAGYLVCGGRVEEIVRGVRDTQGATTPQWTPSAVVSALRILGVHEELPAHPVLSAEGFTHALPPAPVRRAITAAPLLVRERVRIRRGAPGVVAVGAFVVPSLLVVLLLGMVGQWVWGVLPSDAAVAEALGDATPVNADGLQFEERPSRGRTGPAGTRGCAELADGAARGFLEGTPCRGLTSRRYATTVDGLAVLVTVSVVTMPDDTAAARLTSLLTCPKSGHLYDPGEDRDPRAEAVTRRRGSEVVQTRARFADPTTDQGPAVLRRAGQAALRLDD